MTFHPPQTGNRHGRRTRAAFPRLVGAVLACAGAFGPLMADEAPVASDTEEFRARIRPFLQSRCTGCHGPDEQSAGLRFDRVTGSFDASDVPLWTRTHAALSQGKMPPAGEPRPAADETRAVLRWIESRSAAVRAENGSGSRRRLNRREYARLVTGVLGLDLPQFASYLPGDRAVDGFDTVALGLQDAASSVDAYLESVHALLKRVDFLEPPPLGAPRHVERWSAADSGERATRESPFSVRHVGYVVLPGRGLLFPPGKWGQDTTPTLGALMTFPEEDFDGFMRLRIEVASLAPPGAAPPTLSAMGRFFEVRGTEQRPQVVELLKLPKDDAPRIVRAANRPPLFQYPFRVENRQTLPFDPHPTDPAAKLALSTRNGRIAEGWERFPASWLLVTAFEAEAGHRHRWLAPRETARIPADDAGAALVLGRLAEQSFRRPVAVEERTRIDAFFRAARARGLGLDDAIRLTAEFVLCSAETRTLLPTDDPDPVRRQYAIASRLSFGLWSTPPDARLLGLAAAGRLTDRATVAAEVDRLLDDPRSDAGFLQPFARNWLALDQPKKVAQAIYRHPDELNLFREHILESMERESGAYFGIVLAANLPARETIDSDWLPMNDALAYHYGYPRVIGHDFRKVRLRDDDPRGGGMLGQAGVMSMTTWMGDSWPIYRGAWALRHFLDAPPPPPPLEVPELVHEQHRGRTLREIFALHGREAKCAVCHAAIDPLGFAFQNFDVSGRWRDREHESYRLTAIDFRGVVQFEGQGPSRPVDAAGRLPRGETFGDWKDFKSQVAAHYLDDFVRGQLRRYLLHFGSRQPTLEDQRILQRLLDEHRPRGYPMRDLLKAFLASEAFLGD